MYTLLLVFSLFVTFSRVSFHFSTAFFYSTHTQTRSALLLFSSFATPCFRIYVYMYLSHSLRTKKFRAKMVKTPVRWETFCCSSALNWSCVALPCHQIVSFLLFEFFTYNKRSLFFVDCKV